MSANLAEFIKVFLVVFTFSGGILAFRKYMLDMDEEDDETTSEDQQTDNVDYDGIGNQGRFVRSDTQIRKWRAR
tara:strand:+ start:426 stop:647 length:222 start_codon:yes stop_codon:yes gene_type:complete